MELATQLVLWEDGFDCSVGNLGAMGSWCCLGHCHCYWDESEVLTHAVNVGFESLSQKVLLIHFMTRNSNDSFAVRSLLSSPNNYLVLV